MFMWISEIFILNFITFRIVKVSQGIRSGVNWLFRFSLELYMYMMVSSKVLFSCEHKNVLYPISDLLFSSSSESLSAMDLRRLILNV